jgi:lysophospholipase L1-like esterase
MTIHADLYDTDFYAWCEEQAALLTRHDPWSLDWANLAAENPNWLANDDIHCSGKGYQHRSTAIAVASRSLIPTTPPDPGPYRTGRLWTQIPTG